MSFIYMRFLLFTFYIAFCNARKIKERYISSAEGERASV